MEDAVHGSGRPQYYRFDKAYQLLDQAGLSGKYRDYEEALYAFDTALVSGVDNEAAERGRIRVAVAYAREALLKRDFELAITLLDPLTDKSLEARRLLIRVFDKQAAYRLTHRNLRLLIPTFIALAAMIFVVVVNIRHHMRQTGPHRNPLLSMVENFDRSVGLKVELNLQMELSAVYSEFATRRINLVAYHGFRELNEILHGAYDRMLAARGGKPEDKEAVYRYLSEGIPAMRAFREELLAEESGEWRARNRMLAERLERLCTLLQQQQKRVESPLPGLGNANGNGG